MKLAWDRRKYLRKRRKHRLGTCENQRAAIQSLKEIPTHLQKRSIVCEAVSLINNEDDPVQLMSAEFSNRGGDVMCDEGVWTYNLSKECR